MLNCIRNFNDDNNINLILNDDKISLFKYESSDELEDLLGWQIIDTVLVRDNVIKCFVIDQGVRIDESIIFNGNSDRLHYKILAKPEEIIEHWELFVGNISQILCLDKIDEKLADYITVCEQFIKEHSVYVFEISNVNILNAKLRSMMENHIREFIRTNLVLINAECKTSFVRYDEATSYGISPSADIKSVTLSQYPFFLELLCFLESAQKMTFTHLKFLEYYHILEYFITEMAYRCLDDTLKKVVSYYLEGANFDDFMRAVDDISEEYHALMSGTDKPLLAVLKGIDLNFIKRVINKNKLYKQLDKEIFKLEKTNLLLPKWAKPNLQNISRVDINIDDADEFYNRLYYRIYRIRNALVHSKARFRGKTTTDFLPIPEYLSSLEEDVILMQELAIKLCKTQCVDVSKYT